MDGNDPIASWSLLSEAFAYVREERRPFVVEAYTSRLHGHSSSSGAGRVRDETDCLADFEKKLIAEGVLTAEEAGAVRARYYREALEALEQVRSEPAPDPATVYHHTFA